MLSACGGGGGSASSALTDPNNSAVANTVNTSASPLFDAEFRRNYALSRTGVLAANTRGFTGQGVRIGIVDTGIGVSHPDFAGRVAGTYLLRNSFASATIDTNGHGTAVASIAAGARNGVGTQGVAYDATIFSYKLSNASSIVYSDAELAQLINQQVTDGIQIANNSWGGSTHVGSFAGSVYLAGRPQIRAAYRNAVAAGVTFVFAAGNSARNEVEMHAGAAFYDPLLAPQWLAVADVDTNLRETTYTNRCGLAWETCVTAAGQAVAVANVQTGGISSVNGTSFAAPHVSGVLALIKQAFPGLTPAQHVTRLKTTASLDDLTRFDGCTVATCGVQTMRAVFGHGLINADAATQPIGAVAMATSGTVNSGLVPLGATNMTAPSGVSVADLSGINVAVFDTFDGATFHLPATQIMGREADATRALAYSTTQDTPDTRVDFGPRFSFAAMPMTAGDSLGEGAFWGQKLGLVSDAHATRQFGVEARFAATEWLDLSGHATFADDLNTGRIGFDGTASVGEDTQMRLGLSFGTEAGLTDEGIAQSGLSIGLRHIVTDRVELFGQLAFERQGDTTADINQWGQTGALSRDATIGMEVSHAAGALSFGLYQPETQMGGTAEITLAAGRDVAGNVIYQTHKFETTTTPEPGVFIALRGDMPGFDTGQLSLSVQQSPGNVARTDQAAFNIGFQF